MADFISAMGFLQEIFNIHLRFFGVFDFTFGEMTLWFFYACLLIGSCKSLMFMEGN